MTDYYRKQLPEAFGERPTTLAFGGFLDGLAPVDEGGRFARDALIGAAALAAAAIYVNVRTRKADREHPPVGRFVEVDGVKLHVLERGEGSPLVIFHGNGSQIPEIVLSGLVDLAAPSHRVIVFDRPGFGFSERPSGRTWTPSEQAALFAHALAKLGAQDAIVLGHSWGALVALALALDHPRCVRGLVLVCGYYFPTFRPDAALLAMPAWPAIGPVVRHTTSPLLARLLWPALERLLFGPPPTPRRFEREMPVWSLLKPSRIGAAANESGMLVHEATRLAPRYHELRMPVAILAGEDDRLVSVERHAARLAEAIEGSELSVIPRTGHMLHHTVPQRVMRAIEAVGGSGARARAGSSAARESEALHAGGLAD